MRIKEYVHENLHNETEVCDIVVVENDLEFGRSIGSAFTSYRLLHFGLLHAKHKDREEGKTKG